MDHHDRDNFVPPHLADFLNEFELLEHIQAPQYPAEGGVIVTHLELLPEPVNVVSEDVNTYGRSLDGALASKNTATSTQTYLNEHRTVLNEETMDGRHNKFKNEAAKRQRKYLSKLKNEKITLKQQEKTMSAELYKRQRARKKAKTQCENNAEMRMWRACAMRQKEGLEEAEENVKCLEDVVTARANFLEELKVSLQQRFEGLSAVSCVSSKLSPEQGGLRVEDDDPVLLEEFLQDMDLLYARIDEIFPDDACKRTCDSDIGMQPRWGRNGALKCVENVDIMEIPFGFEQTCSAIWTSMVHHHGQDGRGHYYNITDPDNTVAVKFLISKPTVSKAPDMLVHFVTRRYFEDDRMIIVWRALLQGEKEFMNMHSDETGWCILYPDSHCDKEDGTIPTVAQFFVRFAPMNIGDAVGSVDVDLFTKMTGISGEEDSQALAHMMESLAIRNS